MAAKYAGLGTIEKWKHRRRKPQPSWGGMPISILPILVPLNVRATATLSKAKPAPSLNLSFFNYP